MSNVTYKNAAILEAIVQVGYDSAINPNELFTRFFAEVSGQFPTMEPVQIPGATPVQDPKTNSITFNFVPQTLMRFATVDKLYLISLSSNAVVVHVMPGDHSYPGWEAFKEQVASVWSTVERIARPNSINYEVTRYINRFSCEDEKTTFADWFVAGDYIPPAVLRSNPPMNMRIEEHKKGTGKTTVSIGIEKQVSPGHEPKTIGVTLDIECGLANSSTDPISDVLETADKLHGEVSDIFNAVLSTRLRTLLSGD